MLIVKELRYITFSSLVVLPIAVIINFTVLFLSQAECVSRPINRQLILDMDPGADDAMALLLALSKQSKANVLAITTVRGNTGVDSSTRNALLVLQAANRTDVPVYAGSESGLVYLEKDDDFFGYDGLGDIFTDKPPLNLKQEKHAALAIVDIVQTMPGEVTIVCTGPLTNIALALHLYPKLLEQVKELVILGGSYKGGGNKKPGVEFNIYIDPEAAAFVFSKAPKDKPLTVVPLETLQSNPISLDWRYNTLGRMNSCFVKFMNKAERIALPKDTSWRPFDQLAITTVLEPSVVTSTEKADVLVETCGTLGRGAFFLNHMSNQTNTNLITGYDKALLEKIFLLYMDDSFGKCNF